MTKGQASNQAMAQGAGAAVPLIADEALRFANRSSKKSKNALGSNITQKRSLHTSAYANSEPKFITHLDQLFDDVREFVQEEIIPVEHQYIEHEHDPATSWTVLPVMDTLKAKGIVFIVSENRKQRLPGSGIYSFQSIQNCQKFLNLLIFFNICKHL